MISLQGAIARRGSRGAAAGEGIGVATEIGEEGRDRSQQNGRNLAITERGGSLLLVHFFLKRFVTTAD